MAFLSCAMLLAWSSDRKQKSLLYMAVGIFLTTAALSIQSVLSPLSVQKYAIYTAVFYLGGAWLAGLSIAFKFGANFHTPTAVVLCFITMLGIYYYSHEQPSLTTRAYILSFGLGALHILPAFNILKSKEQKDIIDAYLYWCYLLFSVYTVLRPLTLLIFEQMQISDLTKSIYWFVTLLGSILFCMVFAFLLLASSIRNTLRKLHVERDHDALTHLLNRRAFEEAVAKILPTGASQTGTVLMADIDHFKTINDTWGHDLGDQALRNVAQCLQQAIRQTDLAARFGGEEFVLLLPDTDTDVARQIGQRIQRKLADVALLLPDQRKLTISMGISPLHAHENFYDALKRADHALYQAKNAGRDRICVASPSAEAAMQASALLPNS